MLDWSDTSRDDVSGQAQLVYDDRPSGAYDVAAFGRVTVLVAPDRQRAWALCQHGWDDDGCPDWAATMRYLDQYGLADVTVDPRTDWYFHPDGSETFVLRLHRSP